MVSGYRLGGARPRPGWAGHPRSVRWPHPRSRRFPVLALEVMVAIGLALVAAAVAAPRLRVPLALVQVVAGVLLGFIPALRDVQLPSEAVLLLFLPAILFWESITTSL